MTVRHTPAQILRGISTGTDTPAHHRPAEPQAPQAADQILYTPAEAAGKLRVKESWLRRKAGAKLIPRHMVGKHLRFSAEDLAHIVAATAQHADSQAATPAPGRSRRQRRT